MMMAVGEGKKTENKPSFGTLEVIESVSVASALLLLLSVCENSAEVIKCFPGMSHPLPSLLPGSMVLVRHGCRCLR